MAVFALGAGAGSAPAGEVFFYLGAIDPGDLTMPVVFISPPNCTGQGASPVHYEALPFTVATGGNYTFTQFSQGEFASLYLMDATFDPAAAFPHCLAGDNGADPVGFTEALTAGELYYAVPFDDTFDQLGGFYGLIVEGPGVMTFIVFVDGFESGDTSRWSTVSPSD
jgi:hypothetical protein